MNAYTRCIEDMDSALRFLRGDTHLRLDLQFDMKISGFDNVEVNIEISEDVDDNNDTQQPLFNIRRCSDIELLTRFGESIGINKSIGWCSVVMSQSDPIMDPNYLRSPVNAPSYQCLQSIYRGIESNTSITSLSLDLESIGIPGNESFPRLQFQSEQFKSKLKGIHIYNTKSITLTDDDSTVMAQLLEGMPRLNVLNIWHLATRASAFRTIISACPPSVERLHISCDTAEHCSILASFLQSNHLMVSCLDVEKAYHSSIVGEEGDWLESLKLSEQEASIIIDGLKNGNTCLETLYMDCCKGNTLYTSAQTLLCDTTSIESIRSSNHTLMFFPAAGHEDDDSSDNFEGDEDDDSPDNVIRDKLRIINHCLKLSQNTDKNEVIREKIARYYFVGDFDVSPLAKLPVSVVPSVLGMIKSYDVLYRQSAIFRLLKSIPDLCNVGSRVKIAGNDDDIEAAKFGACDNKRRRKT